MAARGRNAGLALSVWQPPGQRQRRKRNIGGEQLGRRHRSGVEGHGSVNKGVAEENDELSNVLTMA